MKKRQILSWCLYDFANSSYSAVIVAVIFPVYFVQVIASNPSEGDLWWGRAISLSMAVVAFTSPIMGGISDYAGMKKRLLVSYSLLCILSVFLLNFVEKGMLFEAFIILVMANIGMEGALVFYNAYLPELARKDYYGRISGWGFGLGYVGSVLSLLISMLLMKEGLIQLSWPMVSIFFLLFSLPAYIFLPSDKVMEKPLKSAVKGVKNTFRLVKEVFHFKDVRKFLIAYWLYTDAINTIIVFSSIYASVTLSFTESELVLLYLLVQITAMAGSLLLATPTDRWGAKKVVMLSLTLWIMVTVGAYITEEKFFFWFIAVFAGLGLGSAQAASRALFSGFIPYGKEGEYFGIYALAGKTSAVFGPLMFGTLSFITGSQRTAVLSVLLLFLLGFFMLQKLNKA